MEDAMAKLVVAQEFSWWFKRNENKVSKGTVLKLNATGEYYMYPGSVLIIGPDTLRELLKDKVVRFQK